MRRGLGIIGIIIAILILIFVLSFIAGTVKSTVEKAPQTIESLGIKLGISSAPYYNLTVLSGGRGYVYFTVIDPATDEYVTDFDKVLGFKVSEDGIPTTVMSVDEYRQLYIATVFEGKLTFPSCDSYVEALRGIAFKDTNIGFFPGPEFFYNKTEANCTYTGQAYWTAIQNATYALPVGEYYHALIIISDGDTTNDPSVNTEAYNETFKDAIRGLQRQDLQYAIILTSKLANCENNVVINATRAALGIERVSDSSGTHYVSPDRRKSCEAISSDSTSYTNVAFAIGQDMPTIKLNYKPYASEDGLNHTIAVKATKKSYYGRNESNAIVYS